MTKLLAIGLLLSATSFADSIVTYDGTVNGANDGADYVMPYLLTINGQQIDATCYDFFDNVTTGQTWTANILSLSEAAASGQFSGTPNALLGYEQVGFLSQQSATTTQQQVDLQHDIWNVFAPGTFTVTSGMQDYLNLLNTPAFTDFNFNTVAFIEDVNQGPGRAQAFVIDPPASAPEPASWLLIAGGIGMLFLAWKNTRRKQSALASAQRNPNRGH